MRAEQIGDDPVPCCDYRDHGSGVCTCPDHARTTLHPFGWNAYGDGEAVEDWSPNA